MGPEERLRRYVFRKYGKEKMTSSIIKMTKKELHRQKCEMCDSSVRLKRTFTWKPVGQKISGTFNMTICEGCAKREHGSKNKYKWKILMEDLS